MRVEEIVITATVPDSAEEHLFESTAGHYTLTQHSRIRSRACTLALLSRRLLSVRTEERFGGTREHTLDISVLDPEPKRCRRISWPHLATFFIAALAAGVAGFADRIPNSATWFTVLAVCAGLALVLTVFRSHDRLVFYSRNGRIPLLVLFNQNPDKDTFDAFVGILIDHIRQAGQNLRLVYQNELLSAELKEHRRLMEAGVILGRRYDAAKARILRLHR